MTPRNQTKAPWTSLPEEFAFKVLSALEEEFSKQAKIGEFVVEGKIFDSEILIRVGYLEAGRLRQMNFEASIDYDRERADIIETFYICVDCLGRWLVEYFDLSEKDEDIDLPIDLPIVWRASEFKNQTVFLQFSTVNSRLEQEADRLLGVASEALFKDDLPGEDAFEHAIIDPDLSAEKSKSPINIFN